MAQHALGDLQHAIMTVLWGGPRRRRPRFTRPCVAREPWAFTTIATMLRKMEDKGVVAHRAEGRQFVYRPTVTEDQVRRSMVGELVERLFSGDPKALVAHLVSEHEIAGRARGAAPARGWRSPARRE